MELLITSLSIFALLTLIILIGTRGRPMRFFTAFGETLVTLWHNRGPLFWTALTVLLVLGFLLFFYTPPQARVGPEQPIAFSHQLHAGVKNIQCEFCHPYVGRSIHPGLPPVEKCLYCHNYIIANHFEIQKEHAYYGSDTPTPWRKAFYLAEHVLFNHQRHIKKEIACEACHGQIEKMDRIKGRHFYMGFCIQCHRERNANLDCWLACHS
jgi:hypothetical protein